MQTSKANPIPHRKPRPSWLARKTRRRDANSARAQALFPDEPPDDVDLMRTMMARKIAMFIGNEKASWRRCEEPCCRRARACIAPRIRCSTAPPRQPDPDGRRAARATAIVLRALKKAAAARGEEA